MTAQERRQYHPPEDLRELIQGLKGMKFSLDCGHHVTFGYYLGNDIIIRNGKTIEIICLECGR